MFKLKYSIGCILLGGLLFSCSKDDHYDVKGDSGVKFFTNSTGAGNAPVNSVSYNVVNIPATGTGLTNLSTTFPGSIKIPVFATKAVNEEVTISAELDTTLVSKYNAANNTSYVAFPAGVLTTTGLSAKIAAGSSTSMDSITIPVNATLLNNLSEKMYIAPIRLTTVSNNKAGSITDNQQSSVIYVVANMEYRRIRYLGTATDAIGTIIPTRTAWTTTQSSTPTTVGSFLDGSTTTFSRWSASPVQVDINMQDVKNVTGVRLYTSNSTTYTPTQVTVYTSTDGVNYDLIGAPLKANLTFASNYNYVLFYKAVPAKFLRLVLAYSTSTNTQNFRLTELDVYAN